ncbi:disulfide bond formation protein B [Denitratisoma sp. agr-D3]
MMLLRPRSLFAFLALAGLGCFFGGVLLGNLMHLAACPLCILQRMLYLAFGVIGLAAVALAHRPLSARIASALLVLAAGTGAYIAAYQSWLQLHPEGPSCTANTPWWENFVYWAGEQAPDLFLSSGMCSDPGFTLFGLSIANYSLIVFSVLGLAAGFQLFRRR